MSRMDWWPVNKSAPVEPGLNVRQEECDACKTRVGPFERISRGGMVLNICVNFRGCNARQPSIAEMAGGIIR